MSAKEEQERIIAMVIRWKVRGFARETCIRKLIQFGYARQFATAFVDKATKRITASKL